MATPDYHQAKKRIRETPPLWPFETLLLADWSDTHFWRWVATADVDEITSWVKDKQPPEISLVDPDTEKLDT